MKKTIVTLAAVIAVAASVFAEPEKPIVKSAPWPGFMHGIGIGGWLTNYKRFNVIPEEKRYVITKGDLEHFESYITERDVKYIAKCGFDHIRLGFDQLVMEEAPGKWREATFKKIDEFLGWAEKYRVNVVLNMHKAIGNYCDIKEKKGLMDSPELQRRFIDCWLEFERRYHDKKDVAFELLNEVRGDADPEKWNDLAEKTLKAIRKKNPDRWIVIGPTCGGHPYGLTTQRVWSDPKVVYTFHNYDPGEFTHQRGVLQAGNLFVNEVMEYPASADRYLDQKKRYGNEASVKEWENVKRVDIAWLEKDTHDAYEFLEKHPGIILWHGEFGTIRHAPPKSRVCYMRDSVRLCQKYGMPYCVWNYLSTPNDGNRFSLVDDDTREFLSPELLNACFGKDVVPKVVLTFDDGFEEHHRLVAPILEKYGFRGVFNIITSSIGKGEVDTKLGRRSYLSWEQVRDLQNRGHEIASHTLTHPDLKWLAEHGQTDKLRRELVESRDAIQRETGVAPRYLCHPFCQTNFEVEEMIREEGMIPMGTRRKNFGTGTVAWTDTGVGEYIRQCIERGETFIDILCHGVTKEGHGWMPYEKVEDFEEHIKELKKLSDAGVIKVVLEFVRLSEQASPRCDGRR